MEKDKIERRKKLLAVLLFLIKLNLFAIPLYILLYLDFSFYPLQNFLAFSISSALSLLKFSVGGEGKYIYIFLENNGSYKIITFDISMDCTGWKSMYLLCALVFACSFDLRKNLKFLIFALPLLFFINFLRIFSTLLISLTFGFEHFEITHNFLWREGMLFFVLLLWYLWLRKTKYNLKDNLILVDKIAGRFRIGKNKEKD